MQFLEIAEPLRRCMFSSWKGGKKVYRLQIYYRNKTVHNVALAQEIFFTFCKMRAEVFPKFGSKLLG